MLYSSFSYKRRASTSPWPTHEAWALLPRRPFAGAARDDRGPLACGSSAVNFFLGRPLRLVPLARHSRDAMPFGLWPARPRVHPLQLPAHQVAPNVLAPPPPAWRSLHPALGHRLRAHLRPHRQVLLDWLQGGAALGVDDQILGPRPSSRSEAWPERRAAALRLVWTRCARERWRVHMVFGENTRARGAAREDRVSMLEQDNTSLECQCTCAR